MLREMLAKESIPYGLMQHDNPRLSTTVMENGKVVEGFYSWNEQHGRAAIIHFLVAKPYRSNEKARLMAQHISKSIKSAGLNGILVAIPETNPALFKFVKYYFKNSWVYRIVGPLMFVRAEV